MPTTTAEDPTTSLFRALMHPTRVAILDLLRDGEQCVCHIEAQLGKRQAYISQQLMVLREAGLVADQRSGANVYYRVTNRHVFAVLDAARALVGSKAFTATTATCNCPQCQPEWAELVLHS